MDNFLICVIALAFLNVVCAAPVWEYEEDSLSPSFMELNGFHCNCSEDDNQCTCCILVQTPPVDVKVCIVFNHDPSHLGVEVSLTFNNDVMFRKNISTANPPPICFGIPHVKAHKACVKFTEVSIKKGHTGACAALDIKAFHSTKDIPLGCFFFRGDDGLDRGTFLDSESVMLLREHLFQDAVGNMMDSTNSLASMPNKDKLSDDVTAVATVNQPSCHCEKAPPRCDCCAQFNMSGMPFKVCVHGDVDESNNGFHVTVLVNNFPVIKKFISVEHPPPICHRFVHLNANVCFKITNASLKSGHLGACAELEVNAQKFSLGCFYTTPQVTME